MTSSLTLSLNSNFPVPTTAPAIVTIDFELVRGAESQFVRDLLPRVKRQSIALDLSAVDRIDAAGIATLITLYCSSIQAGNEFSVVSPSDRVLDMLRIVGLEPILVAQHPNAVTINPARQRPSMVDCGCPAA